ncbi:MAG: hypothetical protein ACYTFK_09480 [Planctomycetota bacterium]|jgi:hypothetical protein
MKHRSLKKKRLFLIAGSVLAAAVIAGFAIFPLAETDADYSQIIGQWVRGSGSYVLDIQKVRSNGKIDASYLNPKSINISRANVSIEAGKINLFVELLDSYYPSSYYTLTYDPQKDLLVGIYHHLGIRQNISVSFSRKQDSV